MPKIVRWRIYLQSFNFKLKHIAGKKNIIADWLSRTFPEEEVQQELASLELDMREEDNSEEDYRSLAIYQAWLNSLYSEDNDNEEEESTEV